MISQRAGDDGRAALDFAGEQIQGADCLRLDALFEDVRARQEEEPEVWPEYAELA